MGSPSWRQNVSTKHFVSRRYFRNIFAVGVVVERQISYQVPQM